MSVEGSTTVRAPSTLRIDVADLLRHPGASEPALLRAHIDGLQLDIVKITSEVAADLRLDSIVEGIAVSGTIEAAGEGVCARCTKPIKFTLSTRIDEAFTIEVDPEDETYPIVREMIDLEPALRDAVLLAAPLHPLCRPDCAGLCAQCGEERALGCGHDEKPIDPRWDALQKLRDQLEHQED